MPTQVIQIHCEADAAKAAEAGARAIREGKLVAFATETVYGIAAAADNPAAMERLRELKNRPERPFSVHLPAAAAADRYVSEIPLRARKLIRDAWPGPITLVLETDGALAEEYLQAAGLHEVLCHEGCIGLRCPDEPVALAMLAGVDAPVVAPSANLAGRPSPRTGRQVLDELDGQVDLLLDSGQTRLGEDSTIVRFAGGNWEVLRVGAVSSKQLARQLCVRILFVCTGNTCRSPMAAGLARKLLAERLGCRENQLASNGFEVLSAGLFAANGTPATPEAVAAAAQRGADISAHRSQKATPELIGQCDVVFCMTSFHVQQILRGLADGAGVDRLDESLDVPDPIGGGSDVYVQTALSIQDALRKRLGKVKL